MRSFLDKFFFRSNNLDTIGKNIRELTKNTPVVKIFDAINSHSSESEIRYVGGCIRKIINGEKVDDIDLASNLEPKEICEVLKKNNINYYETGIEHGTITAVIDRYKFEITTLREDISSDGRHAKVKFSKNWKDDASRRDFTINSIYSDRDGNLFDPYDGKKDLENGKVNFIGDTEKRIKEDYLRILRYIRFYLNYSKQPHNLKTIKSLKMNIDGVSKLSKERLLSELKKIVNTDILEKLSTDTLSLNLISMIFPELKNISVFSKLNIIKNNLLKDKDFIFLLSLMIIDETDNSDYFIYKYNLSKRHQKRIKDIDNFYKEKINSKTFTKNNINKIFYFYGKEATLDILNYRVIKLKKIDNSLLELIKYYENNIVPTMPVSADLLMKKYEIPEGKQLGEKLRIIEKEWVKNNFKISDQEVDNIINN
mgnify:FL=1